MSSVSRPPSPTGSLLTRVGDLVPAPMPAPARALAPDAIRMLRRWHDPAGQPSAWTDRAFQATVESVTAHLAPLRSRRTLGASFAREAFHTVDRVNGSGDHAAAVRVAYALRWLELGLD